MINADQMAEWYGASAPGSVHLGFDSESGQTNDFKNGIHSFPAWRSALKGQCEEQAGKFSCCAVERERERHLFTSHNTAHKKGHITKVFTYIETVCVMKG